MLVSVAILFACLISMGVANASSQNWPQFLGPGGLADAGAQNIPIEFGPDKNLLWRTTIFRGNSSPVIWGKRLFLSGYRDQERVMVALDCTNGNLLWEKIVMANSQEQFTHRLSGPAESTPCTDGKRVYFYFGNYGLIALDFDGALVWEKKLSKPRTGMGTGTSPILVGELLILIRDGTDDPCVLALDTATGEERWKHPRPGYNASHASPFLWKNRLRTELIIAGNKSLVSLNPTTGQQMWKVEDTNGFPCTTPTGNSEMLFFASWSANSSVGRDTLEAHFDDDLVFTDEELENPKVFFRRFDQNQDGVIEIDEMPQSRARDVFTWLDRNDNLLWEPDEFSVLTRPTGKGRNIMVAVKPGGEGRLNDTDFIAWDWRKNLPYVASPLVSENRVYLVKSLGIISCLNTETGEPFFDGKRTGIKGEYFASPIKVGDKILFPSCQGSVFVIKDNEDFEILSENVIDEEIIASPAVVDDTIYLRSLNSLWAFRTGFTEGN
ncbi:MAG: PQQ-binding-like beta-propeller repeat protein [Verrucomicrobia bacterium]|nr:PQQ-binding-like beta-propeller repeat protein [Verrucomicrobiota bacterium]MDA1068874.1 PQQ-binding-like beta-propeller repeat protein [Verrucomicrobiota bacterium]